MRRFYFYTFVPSKQLIIMKKIFYTFLLICPLLFISSCEEEEEAQSGYNCVSNTCSAVFENPQYLTLEDCQTACGDNNNPGGANVEIGAFSQGGIIFYIDSTGQHGLVAALDDLEGLYAWGCYETYINGADEDAIGTGYQNTLAIAAECQEPLIAASATLAYESNGYSDWYLPSEYELEEMLTSIGNNSLPVNIGGFIYDASYWSSTQSWGSWSSTLAHATWYQAPEDPFTDQYYKYRAKKVRPIRSF